MSTYFNRATLSFSMGRCLAIVALMAMVLGGAFGVDLSGKSFAITITTPNGDQNDHLSFNAKDLTSKVAGKIPYTASAKKKSKAITFDASTTDEQGTTTAVTGEVDGQDVHGSITVTTKGGKPVAVNFTSVKTKK